MFYRVTCGLVNHLVVDRDLLPKTNPPEWVYYRERRTEKGGFMPRKKHSPEQVISILHQAEVEQAKGRSVDETCRELQITPFTYLPLAKKVRRDEDGSSQET